MIDLNGHVIDIIAEMRMQRSYCPGYPVEPAPVPVATTFPRCKGCPYAAHGFICWHDQEHCMRTEMERINNVKKENDENCSE